jgi:lipopolysaccharide export system protein LptA
MRPRLLAVLASSAVLAYGSPLVADPLEVVGGEVLDLSADALDIDVEGKTARLTGNVRVAKGSMTVSCPKVDVRFDHVPHVTWVKGSGGVVAEVKGVRAEAPEVELDLAKQTLDLRGGVRLTRGGGWLTAERATIHIATAKVSMSDVKGSIPVKRPGK